MAAVTICGDFRDKEMKSGTVSTFFPIYFPWSDGTDGMIFVSWSEGEFQATFSSLLFHFHQEAP